MIDFFSHLLKKLLINIATTNSVYVVDAIADRNYRRSFFILRVLKSSAANRAAVKAECLASDSDGQHQLADILTIFEVLSAEKKVEFINAFKVVNSLFGGGTPYVAIQNAWQGNHVPPILPP